MRFYPSHEVAFQFLTPTVAEAIGHAGNFYGSRVIPAEHSPPAQLLSVVSSALRFPAAMVFAQSKRFSAQILSVCFHRSTLA